MWINVNTAGTFVLHADIRYECFRSGIELPGVLTDAVLAANGYMPVTQITPVYDPITQGLSAQPRVSNNGVWEQHFVPYPLDPAIVANNCNMLVSIPENAQEILQAAGLLNAALAAAQAKLQKDIVAKTQARLDAFAATRNYDGVLSACTYASSSITRFAAEGQAAVNARDETWATLYAILGAVQAGTRPMPSSFADIEPNLPALVWPA